MSKEQLHYNLYSYFTLNDFEEVKQILIQHHQSIDIMYENGVFFELALVKDKPEILEILLQYANDENIDSGKLVNTLETIVEEIDLSPEMKKVLSPYIDFEGSVDSREHDFDDFNLQLPISFENDQNHEITTSGNVVEHIHNTEFVS